LFRQRSSVFLYSAGCRRFPVRAEFFSTTPTLPRSYRIFPMSMLPRPYRIFPDHADASPTVPNISRPCRRFPEHAVSCHASPAKQYTTVSAGGQYSASCPELQTAHNCQQLAPPPGHAAATLLAVRSPHGSDGGIIYDTIGVDDDSRSSHVTLTIRPTQSC
jgi:hypothetical protein